MNFIAPAESIRIFSERAESYLHEQWMRDTRSFGRFGLRVFLRGEVDAVVNEFGAVEFTYYDRERKRTSIMASKQHPLEDVTLSWRGRYLLVKDSTEKVVNACFLPDSGMVVKKPANRIRNRELLFLRELSPGLKHFGVEEHGIRYRFSFDDIQGRISQSRTVINPDGLRYGIQGYVSPESESFKLVFTNSESDFLAYDLNPT